MYIVYKYKQKVYTFYVIICNTGLMEGCFVLGFKANYQPKTENYILSFYLQLPFIHCGLWYLIMLQELGGFW